MSDFWQRKLGPRPPARPAPAPVTTPSQQPWWAQSDHDPQPYQDPQPQPIAQQPVQQVTIPRNAMSARETETCPNCAGTSYFRPPGIPNAAKRCLECGYPVMHSTSGAGIPNSPGSAPATPAKQISTANNYNPGVIIGRIK